MSNLIFIKDNDNNVGIGSNMINDIKGNINITQNLNVAGNINILNSGTIKTTGIGSFGSITTAGQGSFGSINCGVGTFTTTDINGGTIDNVTIANSTWNGSVSTAQAANSVKISNGTSNGNADRYLLFASTNSTTGAPVMGNTALRYNPYYDELIVGGTGSFPSAGSRARLSIEGISIANFSGQEGGYTSVVFRRNSSSETTAGPETYHGNYPGSYARRMGIDCTGGIWLRGDGGTYDGSNRLFISSDRRIKTDIEEVNDSKALIDIRNIKCYYYSYISKNKLRKHIGFIAQEVFKYLPNAITLQKEFLPNVMKLFKKTDLKEVNINNNIKYNLSSNEFTNINGIRYKFYVSNKIDGSDEECLAIIGNNDNTFTFDSQYTNIFCYGKEVDDFHILNESYIYTLHHSAIQEIDRQQIADKERITNLETKVNTLETANQQQQTKINTLETENAELKSIIDKLKTANSFEEFKQTF